VKEKIGQLESLLNGDENFGKGLFSAQSAEEAQALLADKGISFSLDEIYQLKESIKASLDNSELSDDDLEGVAGGVRGDRSSGFRFSPIVPGGPNQPFIIVSPYDPPRW
jgi:hypothetical protein